MKPDEDDLIVTIDQKSIPPPSIEFKEVSFDHYGYRPVLNQFNLKVGSGEIIALKGSRLHNLSNSLVAQVKQPSSTYSLNSSNPQPEISSLTVNHSVSSHKLGFKGVSATCLKKQ